MRMLVLLLALLMPLPASAQLMLPGLQGEGVGIPLVVDRRTALAEDFAARGLRRELAADRNPGLLTGTQLDELLAAAEDSARQAQSRLEELEAKREALRVTLAAYRLKLEEARFEPLSSGNLPEPAEPAEPTPVDEPKDPLLVPELPGPDAVVEPVPPPPPPPPPPVLSEAEQELLALAEEARRLGIQRLEREVDRDRQQLSLLEIAAQREAMDLDILELRLEDLTRQREAVAIRESDGIFALGQPMLSPGVFSRASEHTRSLLEAPTLTLMSVRRAIARDHEAEGPGPGTGVYFLLALLGGLSVLGARGMLGVLGRWTPQSDSDRLVRSIGAALLPLVPVSLVCGLLATLELVPHALAPLYRFSAVAPPVAAMLIVVTESLFPPGGSDSISPVVSRYLRTLVRVGVVFACAIRLIAVLAPLFEFPEDVAELVRAAFVGWLLLGWLGIALRRKEVLGLLGEGDRASNASILKRGVARLYRVLVLGPVFLFVLWALGYANLARLLLRGGLVTLGVVLLIPWLHARLRGAAEWALGFPDGGGLLALTPDGSRAAYRTVAPLLLLGVGGLSLALLASGWDYQGNVFSNLLDLVQRPLVRIGGSDVTVFSLAAMVGSAAATILVTRWVVGGLNRALYPLYDLDSGTRATLDVLIRYTLYGVGVLIGLKLVKVGPAVLSLFAGVLGIGIGFGSQNLAANFIAGLILLLSRRTRVGDVIEVEGTTGRVARISTFATVVQTLDNLMVVVPNSHMIDTAVVNWSVENPQVRLSIVVGVAYGSDVVLVRRLLLEACDTDTRVMRDPAPLVRFDDFGDSALIFTLLPWTDEPDLRFLIASSLRFRINQLFADHDVVIAFPQLDVHLSPPAPSS